MKRSIWGVITAACLLAGCMTTGPVKQLEIFNPADLSAYEARGTGRVIGEAFGRTEGGDVKLASGFAVYLMPATPYALERLKIMRAGNEPEAIHPAFSQYVRKTVANAQARFGFRDLPPGRYIIYCKLKWKTPTGATTGGYLTAVVSVRDGETTGPVILQPGRATD